MTFPWTLQRYIFREMGKAFLLAAVALAGVVGLGGGILNMIKLGEATPDQLFRLMALLLPLSIALTLPIAALFSAAATYGRLSGDNEFVACRSSGINIHVLFLPCVVLSLLSAGVSFAFTNFVIPGMVRNLNEFIGADVGTLIRQRLDRPRGLTLGGRYRIHADECVTDPVDPGRLTLRGIAFVEVEGDQWVRFGTARELRVGIDRNEADFQVSGALAGMSYYDRKADQFVEVDQQTIASSRLPTPVPQKIKYLNLQELLHYLSYPGNWHEVREEVKALRQAAGKLIVYDALWEDWSADKALTLADGRTTVSIKAASGGIIPRGGGIELTDATIEERRQSGRRTSDAQRAVLEVTRGETIADSGLKIELYDVRLTDGRVSVQKPRETLALMGIDPELIARVERISEDDLLSSSKATANDPLVERRTKAREKWGSTCRQIVGSIHERLAFSISVLVLVILGAALGIILRGSHVITAFGISFVPTLFVIITIVMGKQMANNATTYGLGIWVIWSGILLVAVLDVWTLTRVLRR
jgi:lipopolysaccharide export LptBFGC system permease protein LptF